VTALSRAADAVIIAVLAAASVIGRVVGGSRGPVGRPVGAAWRSLAGLLRLRPDVLTRPSAVGMRRLAVAGVAVNGLLIVSGGLVRVTESGLGCPTWPRCTPESLLPEAHTAVPAYRMAIEFGNRTLTIVLLAVAICVFIAAVHLRDRRPDLARLAVAQPLGVLGQILLGGITVLSGLNPIAVGSHYLLSALVLIACVALYVRAGEGDGPARRTLSPAAYRLASVLPLLGFLVLAAGTVVTGAGPHAGDETAERYDFLGARTIESVARVHSGLVWITVIGAAALYLLARRDGAVLVVRRLRLLGLVIVGQGAVGYIQYALGVPAGLVLLHMLGSALFWIALLYVRFGARTRG
jgi:cytochrome c oxidase assembly protein subunit 15